MQKSNFIIPLVFEILKLENPAIWLAESIFAFNYAHLKLHDQSVDLIDMKLRAQNQLYTSISFWDIKVLIDSLSMPDQAHLKSCHQFVALIDIYLHAKNQLYT